MAYESTTFEQEQGTAQNLKEQAQNALERVRVRGSETVEDAVDLVRRHPGKTMAASLVLGGVIGALIVNAIASASEPETRWDQLQEFGSDAWDKLKDGAEAAMCAVGDLINSARSRM